MLVSHLAVIADADHEQLTNLSRGIIFMWLNFG